MPSAQKAYPNQDARTSACCASVYDAAARMNNGRKAAAWRTAVPPMTWTASVVKRVKPSAQRSQAHQAACVERLGGVAGARADAWHLGDEAGHDSGNQETAEPDGPIVLVREKWASIVVHR